MASTSAAAIEKMEALEKSKFFDHCEVLKNYMNNNYPLFIIITGMKRRGAGSNKEVLHEDLSSDTGIESEVEGSPAIKKAKPSTRELSLDAILNAPKPIGSSKKEKQVGFYSARIRTGIPKDRRDPEILKRIFDITKAHYEQNMDVNHMIFTQESNVRGCWPVCPLTMQKGGQNDFADFQEQKFLSVQFPTLKEEADEPHYFLYKASNRDTYPLKISQDGLFRIIEKSQEVYTFLKNLEGEIIAFGDSCSKSFDPIVIETIDEKSRIMLQVDSIQLNRKVATISPTVSIRLMRRGVEKWYPDRAGVTLSCLNFYYFVEATLKSYVAPVKQMVKEFFEIYRQSATQYDDFVQEIESVE